MKTFYVTFGLGTVCGKNYLICYAPDENTLRVRLNEDRKNGIIPNWAGVYDKVDAVALHGEPLVSTYEAVNIYNSGPCRRKEIS